MKKLLAVLSAGIVALMAVSCLPEEKAIFDETKITAPVLGTYNVGEDVITANYTPAKLELGFNESMAPSHTLAIVALNGEVQSKSLTTTNDGATITLKTVNLAKALMTLGIKEGGSANVELAVRATLQDVSKDNGRNGYVDSEKRIVINNFAVVIPEQVGSPYEDYTEKSDWSLIGAMAAYEINWDGDLCMWTDGNGNHVAAHVTLKSGDEVKFRKDQAWTVNMGGDFSSLDSEFAVSQDGPNIVISADGVYDLFLNESGTAVVSAAYDPYPDFTQATNWTVIGALSKLGINWDGDVDMLSDGTTSAAFGVEIAADDEFKFRQDKAWTVNMGGEFGGMDTEFAVTQDGANIKVGADGVYDLFVNPGAGTAKVTAAAGVKVSTKIGADTPEPPVQEVKGWNIIGLNGDWENDVLATQNGSKWTAYITATDATEFKWRKDGGWDENYGGKFVEYGVPFTAEPGGDNIPLIAGFYMVVLDTEALTITVYDDFTVWSLIGVNGDWATDIDMTEVDGKWVSPATAIDGDFKLRKNHGWDDNRGGVLYELGVAFAAVAGGDNINVPNGEYIVTYDPAAETIVVDAALPSNTWSLIGVNGDWSNDVFMTEVVPGVWVSPEVEITSAGWKVRFNHGWDVNRGGNVTAEGVFAKAVPGGDNINLTGKFKVVYNANNETIGTLVWGVVGTITDWGADVPMNLASDGKWYSAPVTLAASDEIKIRKYAGWDDNFGGDFAEANATFAAVAGGNNIKAEGTYMVVYDPASGTLALSNQFWGLIGDFNSWGADKYMFFDGANWVAYGQTLAGGWKIRQGAGWDVNRGGVFAAVDTPFAAVAGGENINVGDLTNFDVVYNPAAETFFIGDAANAPVGGSTPALFLNEFDTGNKKIEIYNATDAEVDMTGWTLSKDETVWTIPAEHAKVPAKGYIVYTGKSDGTTDPTFGLSPTKGFVVVLKDKSGNIVDQVDNSANRPGGIVTIDDGKSWGRETDGAEKFVIFDTPTIGAPNGAAAVNITIDGNFSDWAAVTTGVASEAETPVYMEFKATSDGTNLYFYSKRDNRAAIWNNGGYFYYDVDADNNSETGETKDGVPGLESWFYIKPFAGTSDAPAIATAFNGSAMSGTVTSNVTFAGLNSASYVEVEVSIPIGDMKVTKGSTIKVYSWSNKDGYDVQSKPITIEVK